MFTVQVIEKSTGRPAFCKKVGLIFCGWMKGVASAQYTDKDGEAHFSEENGEGTIYVQGDKVYEGRIAGRRVVYV